MIADKEAELKKKILSVENDRATIAELGRDLDARVNALEKREQAMRKQEGIWKEQKQVTEAKRKLAKDRADFDAERQAVERRLGDAKKKEVVSPSISYCVLT